LSCGLGRRTSPENDDRLSFDARHRCAHKKRAVFGCAFILHILGDGEIKKFRTERYCIAASGLSVMVGIHPEGMRKYFNNT